MQVFFLSFIAKIKVAQWGSLKLTWYKLNNPSKEIQKVESVQSWNIVFTGKICSSLSLSLKMLRPDKQQ